MNHYEPAVHVYFLKIIFPFYVTMRLQVNVNDWVKIVNFTVTATGFIASWNNLILYMLAVSVFIALQQPFPEYFFDMTAVYNNFT